MTVEPDDGARPLALSMRGMAKSFGGVHAIKHADFELRQGEVHALLGENGAGKSTLMNILSGVIQPDSGEIKIMGKVSRFGNPAAAQASGIGMIHQELDLVPGTTVADNLFLGQEPRTRCGLLDRRAMNKHAKEALNLVGVNFAPNREISSLRTGEQQMVAIAKALSEDAKILVMDEPTSALSETEVDSLLGLVANLRSQGVGIVYISHRMNEISRVADRATVMRDGRSIDTFEIATTSPEEVITKMIGKPIGQVFPDRGATPDHVALCVEGLTVNESRDGGRANPKDISFTVHQGEIVGLAGLLGAGRTEILQTLFGIPGGVVSGTVTVLGKHYTIRSPRAALDVGIAFVPEDRRIHGLVMTDSVASNITLSALDALSSLGLRSRRRESKAVNRSIQDLSIKVQNPAISVSALSGGNQQKVVFAKQLLREPKVLLLDEPTRGVDVGAKAEIYRLLTELAASGMAIIVASSELPELAGICDRVLVLRDGRITAEVSHDEATPETLLAAVGVGDDLLNNNGKAARS